MAENNISYAEKLKNHRRSLHMIPELDRNLPETKKYLLSVLEKLDCSLNSSATAAYAHFSTEEQRILTVSGPIWTDFL